MKDETRLYYDLTAEKTADEWYENDILLPTIKDFISLFSEAPRILDFGCGPGHESKRLASFGARETGIDYSSECVRIAKERCPECKFEFMDFRNLDDSLGQFDGIFASGSLIHLSPDELQDVVSKISDILKKGGLCLMIVQDGKGINKKYSNLEVDGKILKRPVYCYTINRLSDISKKYRLKLVKEGFLEKSLFKQNWRNYIFQKT